MRGAAACVVRWVLVPIAMLGCTGKAKEEPGGGTSVNVPLGGRVVARFGDHAIDRATVAAIARARGITAAEALAITVDEALLAEAARREGGDEEPAFRSSARAIAARALLGRLRAEGDAPFRDDEISTALAESDLWIELDKPETRTVVHALVKNDVPGAEAVAERLRAALATATGDDPPSSARAFREAAAAFPMPTGHALVVEDLSPITEDGRVADRRSPGNVEVPFAKGAFAVEGARGTSAVVATSYGFHVIRVLAVDPPRKAPRAELVAKLEPWLLRTRIAPVSEALLTRLRKETPTEIVASDADLALPR
jgi:hypothetical protein